MSITETNPTHSSTAAEHRWPQKHDVLGVAVSQTDYDQAVASICYAATHRLPGVVSCHAVHAVVTIGGDAALREKVNQFSMVTPDGQPVRWALNLLHKTKLAERVYGPELMARLCCRAAEEQIPVYLYGGSPEVAEKLQVRLVQKFPDLEVAGAESPPYRSLSADELNEAAQRINDSQAGIVFIGLGCPKQDAFAADVMSVLRPVAVCVGAAFDFHAGVKPMAPLWMQKRGLEWLFRLASEPRRLWNRYLTTNSIFIFRLILQFIRSSNK